MSLGERAFMMKSIFSGESGESCHILPSRPIISLNVSSTLLSVMSFQRLIPAASFSTLAHSSPEGVRRETSVRAASLKGLTSREPILMVPPSSFESSVSALPRMASSTLGMDMKT